MGRARQLLLRCCGAAIALMKSTLAATLARARKPTVLIVIVFVVLVVELLGA